MKMIIKVYKKPYWMRVGVTEICKFCQVFLQGVFNFIVYLTFHHYSLADPYGCQII